VIFKGEVLAGEQPAIVDRDLFEAVQAKLSEQLNNHKTARMKSEGLACWTAVLAQNSIWRHWGQG
jgi:site-specific DNA recombinase